MEVEDVSHIEQWAKLLAKQKSTLENASKRKGQRPQDRNSRDQLVNDFMIHYIGGAIQIQQSDRLRLHSSFVAPPYPPSVKALSELKPIFVRDLKLETHHRGNYIKLKAITPPNGVMLQVYQHNTLDDRSVKDAIPANGVCIVKEPYFKTMADGHYGLRADYVTDIVWMRTGDDKIPPRWQPQVSELKEAKELKEEGNAAIKAGEVREAVDLYTRAILSSPTGVDVRLIKLNRSLAYLKLGFYDNSITDAGRLMNQYQTSDKGYYRAARSLYELGRFEESRDVLELPLSQYPQCEAAKTESSRTACRLREQKHGEFDFKAMYEAASKIPPHLDHATYAGPVEIKLSDGRARGLFTTKAVAAGDLLLCEKAFTHCFAAQEAHGDTAKVSSRTSVLMHTHNNRITIGTQADLITATVQKVYRNPSLMSTLLSLHHGDYAPVGESEVDGNPIVDTFLITEIIRLNVFGCPRTSLDSHFTSTGSKTTSEAHHTSALFLTASYINHSCFSNARRSFIGDMQLVRATRDIPAGAEIFFWYAIPECTGTYEKIQGKLSNWGFKCTCIICQENQKTKKSIINKRKALLEDLKTAFTGPQGPDIAKAERIVAAIEKTYSKPASETPRLALHDPYYLLSRFYSKLNKPLDVITTAWRSLTALGFVFNWKDPRSPSTSDFQIQQWGLMVDASIEIWVHVWVAYAQVAPHLCSKAEGLARTCYRICIGEDGTFDDRYGDIAKRAIHGGGDLVADMEKMGL